MDVRGALQASQRCIYHVSPLPLVEKSKHLRSTQQKHEYFQVFIMLQEDARSIFPALFVGF